MSSGSVNAPGVLSKQIFTDTTSGSHNTVGDLDGASVTGSFSEGSSSIESCFEKGEVLPYFGYFRQPNEEELRSFMGRFEVVTKGEGALYFKENEAEVSLTEKITQLKKEEYKGAFISIEYQDRVVTSHHGSYERLIKEVQSGQDAHHQLAAIYGKLVDLWSNLKKNPTHKEKKVLEEYLIAITSELAPEEKEELKGEVSELLKIKITYRSGVSRPIDTSLAGGNLAVRTAERQAEKRDRKNNFKVDGESVITIAKRLKEKTFLAEKFPALYDSGTLEAVQKELSQLRNDLSSADFSKLESKLNKRDQEEIKGELERDVAAPLSEEEKSDAIDRLYDDTCQKIICLKKESYLFEVLYPEDSLEPSSLEKLPEEIRKKIIEEKRTQEDRQRALDKFKEEFSTNPLFWDSKTHSSKRFSPDLKKRETQVERVGALSDHEKLTLLIEKFEALKQEYRDKPLTVELRGFYTNQLKLLGTEIYKFQETLKKSTFNSQIAMMFKTAAKEVSSVAAFLKKCAEAILEKPEHVVDSVKKSLGYTNFKRFKELFKSNVTTAEEDTELRKIIANKEGRTIITEASWTETPEQGTALPQRSRFGILRFFGWLFRSEPQKEGYRKGINAVRKTLYDDYGPYALKRFDQHFGLRYRLGQPLTYRDLDRFVKMQEALQGKQPAVLVNIEKITKRNQHQTTYQNDKEFFEKLYTELRDILSSKVTSPTSTAAERSVVFVTEEPDFADAREEGIGSFFRTRWNAALATLFPKRNYFALEITGIKKFIQKVTLPYTTAAVASDFFENSQPRSESLKLGKFLENMDSDRALAAHVKANTLFNKEVYDYINPLIKGTQRLLAVTVFTKALMNKAPVTAFVFGAAISVAPPRIAYTMGITSLISNFAPSEEAKSTIFGNVMDIARQHALQIGLLALMV